MYVCEEKECDCTVCERDGSQRGEGAEVTWIRCRNRRGISLSIFHIIHVSDGV